MFLSPTVWSSETGVSLLTENAQESRRDSLRTTETQLENPSRLRRNYHSDHHDRFR